MVTLLTDWQNIVDDKLKIFFNYRTELELIVSFIRHKAVNIKKIFITKISLVALSPASVCVHYPADVLRKQYAHAGRP